jgi:3D (Asp-Asp-Asp) domain-containing protein
MKQFTTILLAGLACAPTSFAREDSLLARVTVYWARGGKGSDDYTRQHKSATGLRLQQGHCAVDPGRIPYGSRIILPDGTALSAVDTGTAVRNRKAARQAGRTVLEKDAVVVDKFFETKQQALSWATRNPPFVKVRVLPPNVRPPQRLIATSSVPTPRTVPVTASNAIALASSADYSTAIRNPLNRLGR